MSYARTTWSNGDTITAAKLNNIETGILGNESDISTLSTTVESNSESIATNATNITELGNSLSTITGVELIEFTEGAYIKTNVSIGDTVSLTPTSNGSFGYAIADCNEGDIININAYGWTTARLWAFIDSNNALISKSNQSLDATSGLTITAPANSAKVILNSYKSDIGQCNIGQTVPQLVDSIESEIADINSLLIESYDSFENGTVNSYGVETTATNRMRSSAYVEIDRIKSISVNSNYRFYFYYYDAYENFLGFETTGLETFPTSTKTVSTIKTTYPTVYYMRVVLGGISSSYPVQSNTFTNVELSLILNNLQEKTITVATDGSGDYTSILRALKLTSPKSTVIVKQGTYDEISEYEDYYGSDFWTNYAGYGGLGDEFLRGYFVSNGRTLIFESGAVVEFLYDGTNSAVDQYFSPLASGYNATIIGGHIKYSHARYGLHDDLASHGGTNIFDGIVFEGSNVYYGNQIGGGMGKANTYYLKNLVFIDDGMTSSNGDLYYHNNANEGAVNRLFLQNCYGERDASFLWYGDSTDVSYVVASNNHFTSITCSAHSATPNTNVNIELIKFNNTETNA